MLRAARLLCAVAPAVRTGLAAPSTSACNKALLDIRWPRCQSTLTIIPPGWETHPATPDAGASDGLAEHNRALVVRRPDAPPTSQHYKVEANYIGSFINVNDLHARPEFQGCFSAKHRGALLLGPHQSMDPDTAEEEGKSHGPYLVAFPYGSVVMIGKAKLPEREHWLEACREAASNPLPPSDRPFTEEYMLSVRSDLPVWSQLTPDNILLQQLDLKNIQVISQVMGQSVALDYYSSRVEQMLSQFTQVNREMVETLDIRRINRGELLRLVAENNITLTDIINKLGVNERFDVAWKYGQYGRIWDYLRSELEMDARFRLLELKLDLVQDGLKYFLEIFQNRKSDSLEWIIIVLIAVEIMLTLLDFYHRGQI